MRLASHSSLSTPLGACRAGSFFSWQAFRRQHPGDLLVHVRNTAEIPATVYHDLHSGGAGTYAFQRGNPALPAYDADSATRDPAEFLLGVHGGAQGSDVLIQIDISHFALNLVCFRPRTESLRGGVRYRITPSVHSAGEIRAGLGEDVPATEADEPIEVEFGPICARIYLTEEAPLVCRVTLIPGRA